MKSLLLLEANVVSIRGDETGEAGFSTPKIVGFSHDPSSEVVFAIQEEATPSGTAELVLYMTTSLPRSVTEILSWSLEGPFDPALGVIKSFKFHPESNSVVVVSSNGDIDQIFDPSSSALARRENVGAVETGIVSAAWSLDDEILALVTGANQLIVMTKEFEVLSEAPLHTSEFGEDAPVNLHWGSKTTQFHGSVGKQAAQAAAPSSDLFKKSIDDDFQARISWRGDSAFFTISSIDPSNPDKRTIRVFSRLGVLSSTTEPVDGLGHALSWRPSGSIITATRKIVTDQAFSHEVIFFERNGLRRYEFHLRENDTNSVVKEVSWSPDSDLIAVWIKRESCDAVQIWYRNNYHWYLKQEITSPGFTSVGWHPERGQELFTTTKNQLEKFVFCWDSFSSSRAAPKDDGSVAVVDGREIKLTPFRFVNVAPPMSATSVTCQKVARHVSFSPTLPTLTPTNLTFSACFDDGSVQIWNWTLPSKVRGAGKEPVGAPVLGWESSVSVGNRRVMQCACLGEGDNTIVALLTSNGTFGDSIVILVTQEGSRQLYIPDQSIARIVASPTRFIVETLSGSVYELSPSLEEGFVDLNDTFVTSFGELCPWIRVISDSDSVISAAGLASSNHLFVNSKRIASNATSMTLALGFLVYTSFTHEIKFIPLDSLDSQEAHSIGFESQRESTGFSRGVERGSDIISCVPSVTSLVLQMPRGNLETICPRPLVLQLVRTDLDKGRYRAAFLACRRHRIDLNILYDHNPALFLTGLAEFVTQVKEVDFLNLFISGLKAEDVTETMYRPFISEKKSNVDMTNKINDICDAVRGELQKRDTTFYTNTILTTYVRKQPPDYESALKVIAGIKSQNPDEAEEAIKYIIFLSDANKLYDLALGMYDFTLVLLVAQNSQKDPREYLPFLKELRFLDTYTQRFRIDDHLERFESALMNLSKAGPEHFEEALVYTKKHALYTTALKAYKDDAAKHKLILGANAEYFMETKKYSEAGLLFFMSSQIPEAIEAYKKANTWRELFNVVFMQKRPASEIKAIANEVAGNLKAKRRFAEAGQVLLDYARDVEGSVAAFVEGELYPDAIRLSSLYARRDLIDSIIKDAILISEQKIVEDISNEIEKFEKQLDRLSDLEQRRIDSPDQYFCIEGRPVDDIEIQPDGMSDAGTAFTRYTAAPTTVLTSHVSKNSSRTARSRRRGALKKVAGRKGTIYEEQYLLRSIKKTVEDKLKELQVEAGALLPVLVTLSTSAHREAALELQQELSTFESFILKGLNIIYNPREKVWKAEKAEEMEARESGQWVEKPPVEDELQRVERPKIASERWKLTVLESL